MEDRLILLRTNHYNMGVFAKVCFFEIYFPSKNTQGRI